MVTNGVIESASCLFIAGCGDIGLRVAALERSAGRSVAALARSESSSLRLSRSGIKAVSGDLDKPASLRSSPIEAEELYYFAPPPPSGKGDPRLKALLCAFEGRTLPRRVVYISTSGVYGDCGGRWVDEEWPLNPLTDRARRRVAAEALLREWGGARGVEWVILRVPGIYGPGRLPEERLKQAVPVVREEESPWSNRIHADDLAQACFLALRRGRPGGVYNVSDGHPTTMTDYFYQVADYLGLPRPSAISMEEARRTLSPGMLSFLEESKRLDNRRMREELNVVLRYPDLASGLPACLEREPPQPGVEIYDKSKK